MELKNYQEDVVLRAIEIALEDERDLLADRAFVNDVAAYVLNRVPPRYVMSERGFLRLALEHIDDEQHDESLANVIELMMLVNQGVGLVRQRRESPAAVAAHRSISLADSVEGFDVEPGTEYLHNYPQFIGRLLDRETRDPIYGATVTLYLDGDVVPPAAAGWHNPYVTHERTRGHFSFWPRPTRSERETLALELLFTVEHPDYEPFRHAEPVATEGSFDAERTIRGDAIVSLPVFELAPLEGGRS